MQLGIRLQDALREAGQLSEAREIFRRAQVPSAKAGALEFLRARLRSGEDALEGMRAALAADDTLGNTPTRGLRAAWRTLREQALELDRLEDAAFAAQEILRYEPTAWDWRLAGWVDERRGNDVRAVLAYRRSAGLDTANAWTRSALAHLLVSTGSRAEALQMAMAATQATPDDATAWRLLLEIQGRTGEVATAEATARTALRLCAGQADALAALAQSALSAGQKEVAREAATAALALEVQQGLALRTLGILHYELKEYDDARDLLQRAEKASPKDARTQYFLGLTLLRLGREASAVTALRRAAQLEPDSVVYLTELGLAYARKGAHTTAIETLEKAAELAPKSAAIQRELGLLRLDRRNYKEALAAMASTAELEPLDPRPWYYIAIIQGDHLGKNAETLSALRRYRDLGGKSPTMLRWLDRLEQR